MKEMNASETQRGFVNGETTGLVAGVQGKDGKKDEDKLISHNVITADTDSTAFLWRALGPGVHVVFKHS